MSRLWWTLVIPCVIAACQPMYGARPQKLKTPREAARPAAPVGSAAAPVVPTYDEHCGVDRRVQTSTTPVRTVAEQADRKRVEAGREPDAKKRAALAIEAVEHYRAVLAREPYHQEATLGLAVAYDMLRRKQCALTLLTRIAALAKHPRYRTRADQLADEVKSTPAWFGHYRTDAERAVGR